MILIGKEKERGGKEKRKNLVIGPRVLNTDFTDLKIRWLPLCDSVSSFPLLSTSRWKLRQVLINYAIRCKLERIPRLALRLALFSLKIKSGESNYICIEFSILIFDFDRRFYKFGKNFFVKERRTSKMDVHKFSSIRYFPLIICAHSYFIPSWNDIERSFYSRDHRWKAHTSSLNSTKETIYKLLSKEPFKSTHISIKFYYLGTDDKLLPKIVNRLKAHISSSNSTILSLTTNTIHYQRSFSFKSEPLSYSIISIRIAEKFDYSCNRNNRLKKGKNFLKFHRETIQRYLQISSHLIPPNSNQTNIPV